MGQDAKDTTPKSDLKGKKNLRYSQISWVNELCSNIEKVSGFDKSSPGYWLILEFARYLHSRLFGRYISTRTLAYISWLLIQLLCGYAFENQTGLMDSEVIDRVREYLRKLIKDDNDIDGFRGQVYYISNSQHYGKKRYLGVERYIDRGVLSKYPKLPSRRTIGQLAGVMTLSDCYDNGYYIDIGAVWDQIKDEERVELSAHVPRSIALQFRLMALFAVGRPEDMLSVCVMHCWERLGRLLLRKSESTQGLSTVIEELVKD